MQIEQLTQGIEAKFKQNRIVFWHDPDQSFRDEISSLSIDDVTVLDMSLQSVLEVKKLIELDAPSTSFLLYFPSAELEPEKDCLLDIRLYSDEFFADASSMLLNELGIAKMALRDHIRQRQSFFANKQRFATLKRFVTENEDAESLDRKMIAAVVKADSASLNDILLKLMSDYADSLASGGDVTLLKQLDKHDLTASLWRDVAQSLSYQNESPSLVDFALKLFCTELWSQIDAADRDWLLNNVLGTASGKATALAFMASWRDSRSYADSHDVISKMIATQLEVDSRCSHYEPHQLLECETFEAIEQAVIRGLVKRLLDSEKAVDRVEFNLVLSRRLDSHWCLRREYVAAYEALRNAELLLHLRQQFDAGFHYDSVKAMYDAYTQELYQFDQAYRLFNEHVQVLFNKGAEILRQLDDAVENLYTNWYLTEVGTAWDSLIAKENLLETWQLEDVNNQYQFYDKEVVPRLASKATKRVFVIISDAMRYEVAQELTASISKEKRFNTELSSQLGVLPSYTQLGMASLLPHSKLSYQPDKNSYVYVDGKPSQGLENRHSILQNVNGMAVSSKDLMTWSNDDGRDAVRDADVVYIYHDTIDAIGDKAATEDKTFEACRSAVNELTDLVARVINRLNASRVVITADHGFLFQQKSLEQPNKTAMKVKAENALEAKKRYIIGNKLPSGDAYWKGLISNTSNGSSDTEFLLPKGAQRFHFVGGAKFVHGGAMLQEVCVPIIGINTLRGEKAVQNEKKTVGVIAAKQSIKIVNNIDKIRFIQTDPVNDNFVARQLDIYIIDAEGKVVSSRETLNFDSTSKVMDERVREARLKLIGADFDRNERYTLVLENVDTQTRHNQYAVTIDLAFQDDFF
ncbi:MAG: BREX-1 system phosphatase PglZ type A [Gammaproteobacteria bacterium]|nr:BREX-1 system phosphatase PglZ type A [Gammaproteobacteria bacterium]